MRTLRDVLRAMFPYGTTVPEVIGLPTKKRKGGKPSYEAPHWPPDLFAVSMRLLDLSGAYHHVSPASPAVPLTGIRRLQLSTDERDEARRAGEEWRQAWRLTPGIVAPRPAYLEATWERFSAHLDEPIYVTLSPFAPPPDWWALALRLMIVADEASREVGFEFTRVGGSSGEGLLLRLLDLLRYVEGEDDGQFDDNFFSASFANRDMACVMPKSRTPRVGCTLRSLSHNLALLPPRGEVRARWFSAYDRDPGPGLDRPLKMLIVPFPYAITADCFSRVGSSRGDWGWFEAAPKWLGKKTGMRARATEFAAFVVDLVRQASASGSPVGAVIIPEASLNEVFYHELANALIGCPDVEILVNGTTESPVRRGDVAPESDAEAAVPDAQLKGNFVSQTLFFEIAGKRQAIRSVREKHHRWRIDEGQIRQYGIEAQLDPTMFWWERIDITSRSLDVMAFRPGATITSLICEDLARVDPCQVAVRAIGPTILVSLLMDSSQIGPRWPARYATVLAEDPGCSVLTVTSLGLIARTVAATIGGKPAVRSIGLWRDSVTGQTELVLDDGAHALCMTIRARMEAEGTLEGRSDDGDAVVWYLEKADPLEAVRSVTAAAPFPDWIVRGPEALA